jgi:hypothetical protein
MGSFALQCRETISRPNRPVCDRLHGGPTAKLQAIFAAVREAVAGTSRLFAAVQRLGRFRAAQNARGASFRRGQFPALI